MVKGKKEELVKITRKLWIWVMIPKILSRNSNRKFDLAVGSSEE